MDANTVDVVAKAVVGTIGLLVGLWLVLVVIKWTLRIFAKLTDKGLENSARLAGKATTRVLEAGAKVKSAFNEGRKQ